MIETINLKQVSGHINDVLASFPASDASNNVAIILNGPPGCGKDTIAKSVCDMPQKRRCVGSGEYHFDWCTPAYPCTSCRHSQPVLQREFKAVLYKATAEFYGIPIEQFLHIATDRTLKERPSFLLGGVSPRSALIRVSEQEIKPLYGLDYFGRQEAAEVAKMRQGRMPHFDAIYSDGGFLEEVDPLLGVFSKICIVRLHRKGYSFRGDSRSHMYPVGLRNIFSCDVILETGNIQSGVNEVIDIYKSLKRKCN
jgi:hypothetical protein